MSPVIEAARAGASTTDHALLLYDGTCGLCDGFVAFIAVRDHAQRFRFVTLQSPSGQHTLARHALPAATLDTVVYVAGGRARTRSDAALRAIADLGGAWRLAALFLVVPRPLRDACYTLI